MSSVPNGLRTGDHGFLDTQVLLCTFRPSRAAPAARGAPPSGARSGGRRRCWAGLDQQADVEQLHLRRSSLRTISLSSSSPASRSALSRSIPGRTPRRRDGSVYGGASPAPGWVPARNVESVVA